MGARVKTSHLCFINGRRYRPGDVFELPDGVKPAAYMEQVGASEPAKVKPKGKAKVDGPNTFSEIAAQDAKMIEGADLI